jgi:hypothetical protein
MMIRPGLAVTVTREFAVMPDTLAIGCVIRTPKSFPQRKRWDWTCMVEEVGNIFFMANNLGG